MGVAVLVVVVFSPRPTAAFSFHVAGFYIQLPLVGHYYHRHHVMRVNPNEARTRPNDVSDSTAAEQADREARAETNTEVLESCTGLAPGMINLSIDQIRQTVQPTADQEAAGT